MGDLGTLFKAAAEDTSVWGLRQYRDASQPVNLYSVNLRLHVDSSGRWCIFGMTADRAGATWPEWMYFQEFYFEPRAGGEVMIFGFYNNNELECVRVFHIFYYLDLPVSYLCA